MCRFLFIVLGWVILGAISLQAQGQEGGVRGVRSVRLASLFDFEDTDAQGYKIGLGHPLPRNWYAIGRDPLVSDRSFLLVPIHEQWIHRAGYPTYGTVHFDQQHTTSGDFSLKLAINGGHAGAFLAFGALAAIPGSDYRITGNIRTQDLQGASAQVRAYFMDATGRQIEPSVVSSAQIRTRGQWQKFSVSLPGDFTNAAYIGITVELLQPGPGVGYPLGQQQLVFQDVRGQAWFDDLAVWQLPHVQVSTASRLNVHKGTTPPTFDMVMRDLTGQQLTATVVVYDHAMREVDRSVRQVGDGAPNRWSWTANLPGYGWYLVDLRVSEGSSSQPVARTFGAVLWLADEGPVLGGDASRFTLVAEDLPASELVIIEPLLSVTGLESVVLSLWDRQTTLATLSQREARLDGLLSEVVSAGRTVTLSLHPIPTALAQLEGVTATHALGVLQADPKLWLAYLQPMLRRHGQRVHRWQLGSVESAEAFFYNDPPAILEQIYDHFRQLTPRPRLIVPWRMDQARRSGLDAELLFAMDVGPGVSYDAIGQHMAEWQDASLSAGDTDTPARISLYLREAPADVLAPQSRIDNLALRMIKGWQHGAHSLAIARPWTKAAERRQAIVPDPLLGVFVNVARRLAGRSVIAEHLPIGAGLRAMVLNGQPGGMIIAWSESADENDKTIRMVLGDQPVAIDVWGNRTPVALVDGKHELTLSSTPIFIEGIDAQLALLRAGFHVTDSFIDSAQKPHPRTLSLSNPYSVTISGLLSVTGPETWDISPIRHVFSLAPGQTAQLPVVMRFPLSEVAGPKRLTAHVEFDADRHYSIDLFAPMELGLRDIEFSAVVTLEPGTDGRLDAVVTAITTNTGEKARSLYLFAILPDHPREERLLANLQPGQSSIKRLRFRNIQRNSLIRTGIRETNGPTMLNQILNLGIADF